MFVIFMILTECGNKEKSQDSNKTLVLKSDSIGVICTTYDSSINIKNIKLKTNDALLFDGIDQAASYGTKILKYSIYKPNFDYYFDTTGKTKNAQAIYINGKRAVVMNNTFLQFSDVNSNSNFNNKPWASIGILAHEIGHHLQSHRISSRENELEADGQIGMSVAYLGGTLPQALSAVAKLSDDGDATHPPKKERENEIRKGWENTTLLMKNWKNLPFEAIQYSKCLDSLNSTSCRTCGEKSNITCMNFISNSSQSTILKPIISDTCSKVDLFFTLASSIDRLNSFKSINMLTEAQNELLKVKKIIFDIKNKNAVQIVESKQDKSCIVLKGGRSWDKCKSIEYEKLAFQSLKNENLSLAKSYFAQSYAAFPWQGVVDEIYHNELSKVNILTKKSQVNEVNDKLFVKKINQQIVQKYGGNLPKDYREFVISENQ